MISIPQQKLKNMIDEAIEQIDQQINQCMNRATGEAMHMDAVASMIATKQKYIDLIIENHLIDAYPLTK